LNWPLALRLVPVAAFALDGGGGELQRGGDLIGLDLDDAASLALVRLLGPQAQPADHDGPGAFGEGFGEVLRELSPAGDAKEAGLSVCPGGALADAGGDG
jgi:hypothetical protein